ncbi:MAG: hypothetical protein U9P14_04165 [Gemmatimonadota bacterium]|nr:hypothetical protein [Gemmatimonadota bacterium]
MTQMIEIKVLGVVIILLLIGWLWIRRSQRRRLQRHGNLVCCRDIILNKRHALAKAGADFEALADLVKMQVTAEQLEAVVELLIAPRKHYNIDSLDDAEALEMDLDFAPGSCSREGKQEEEIASGDKDDRQAGEKPGGEEDAEQADEETPSDKPGVKGVLNKQEEDLWFSAAHKRFIQGVTANSLSDRRAQIKLLATMVELGKKAVDEDPAKPELRKEYERKLWDRFYEKEYLDIHS